MDSAAITWICSRCKAVYTERRDRCVADGRRVIVNLRGVTFGGRWVAELLLGVGGDGGTVWKAAAPHGERDVAIKVLPASDQTALQRFERGARISGMLEHRHITRVIEHGKQDDWTYLVMELLEGETIQRLLSRVPRMPPHDVVMLGEQMLDALEYTHAMNVVHRDLKPANVFVCRGPEGAPFVKLLDFGISKQFLAEETARPTSALLSSDELLGPSRDGDPDFERLHITEERQILGTPEYMAPEQITGGALDHRADIYGLGVLLYRMLAGRLPFEAKTRVEMYQRHLIDEPPPLPPEAGAPPELERVIMRAIAKHADDRWTRASEMRRALLAARAHIGQVLLPVAASGTPEVDPIPTGSATRARARSRASGERRGVLIAGAVALVALIVALVVLLLPRDEPKVASPTPTERGDTSIAVAAKDSPPAPSVALATTPAATQADVTAPAPADVAAADAVAPDVAAALDLEVIEPATEPDDAVFYVTAGSEPAEIFWNGRSYGKTPVQLSVPRSRLPIELTLKRPGFKTATRRFELADSGHDVDVPLVRLTAIKKPDPPPGGTINLQR